MLIIRTEEKYKHHLSTDNEEKRMIANNRNFFEILQLIPFFGSFLRFRSETNNKIIKTNSVVIKNLKE